MIKKLLFIFLFLAELNSASAQFFRGFGLFGGVSTSRHRYRNYNEKTDTNYIAFNPPTHNSAERISWNAGLFLEFLKYDYVRWQTELEYTNKGAVERPVINQVTSERGAKETNKYAYVQWNNYLKCFLPEGYRGKWYGMLGVRAEYNLSKSTPVFTTYAGSFRKINVTPDVAIGYEFISYRSMKLFTELHYSRDLLQQSNKNNIKITNRTWELRVGLVFRPMKAFDDCNAPQYHDNYY